MKELHRYLTNGITELFLLLLLVITNGKCTDPDAICPQRPIYCLECKSSENKLCADPMNSTIVKKMHKEICDGFCVKWIRKPKEMPGYKEYIRTCSKKMIFHIQINMVCIRESRSGSGYMCFCNKENCNSSRRQLLEVFGLIFSSVMLTLFNFL